MTVYVPKSGEIAGLDLIASVREDGKLVSGAGTVWDEFPKEIKVGDTIFTLEFVKRNRDEFPDGADVMWGVYV